VVHGQLNKLMHFLTIPWEYYATSYENHPCLILLEGCTEYAGGRNNELFSSILSWIFMEHGLHLCDNAKDGSDVDF